MCPTLGDPMDCSTPDFPDLHCLPEFAQIHVHWVGEAICRLLFLLPSIFKQHQGLFKWVKFFASGGQSIGASASASVLSMNIQNWFPLGLTGLISLQSKGLARVFSDTIAQKHQFFNTQLSLWSNSHIHSWLLEKPKLLTIQAFVGKVMSLLLNMLSRS